MSDQNKLRVKQILADTKDWAAVHFKCLFGEKNSISAMWKLVSTAIGYISSIFAFSVLLKDLVGFDNAEELCRNYWWVLIFIGAMASIIRNHETISCKGSIEDDDLQIVVKVKDLFCTNASSYVIPTNTYFRTVMDGEYISPQSVQGAFQIKYFNRNRALLDELISGNLQQQGIVGEDCSDIYGAVKKYPIGTVAKIDHKDKHYYFVAINDVNIYGKPENQRYENVEVALNGLLATINKLGHCDELAIPLIGTGRAAIREATIEKVVENIVDRFLKSQDKLVRKLIICIRPMDYLEDRVNMKTIEKYIDYKCEFS